MVKNTMLPSAARSIAPAPDCPGLPLEAPSNSRTHEHCTLRGKSSCEYASPTQI